ncbi:MAG TPA: DUF1786 domain-containing protein [Dehalococcoidales bacterium]|nr:DUF1786 domain-containing protein [Dehalococcoidales bacterium]
MRILAVDIGMGTQDILLFDSSKLLENCVQMVMPSPTTIVANKIYQATARHHPILLSGVTMGGGPSKWALTQHTTAGLAAYATVEAALTFNDDLEVVKGMGVTILAPDEVPRITDLEVIELKDVDLGAIRRCLDAFGVEDCIDALSIAILDHGFAPGISNRLFRFDHLRKVLTKKRGLLAFCYLAEEVPDYLTRMKSVVKGVGVDIPLLLIDTGVAAILGALQDEEVTQHNHLLIVNIGNGHTIAFHLFDDLIEGLFEHHTRHVNAAIIDSLIIKLAQGVLTNEEIYSAGGHGALVFNGDKQKPFIAITGPRHDLMSGSSLQSHRAVPHGNIMLTGCYGLIKACALRMAPWHEEIEHALIRRT